MNKELRKVIVKENEFKDGVLQPVEVEFQLVNEYFSTSRSWGHISTLFRNGVEVAETKIRYYNRTWEAYEYQSAMYSVVDMYNDAKRNQFLSDYLTKQNKNRFARNEKLQALDEYKNTQYFKEYEQLRNAISTRNFD